MYWNNPHPNITNDVRIVKCHESLCYAAGRQASRDHVACHVSTCLSSYFNVFSPKQMVLFCRFSNFIGCRNHIYYVLWMLNVCNIFSRMAKHFYLLIKIYFRVFCLWFIVSILPSTLSCVYSFRTLSIWRRYFIVRDVANWWSWYWNCVRIYEYVYRVNKGIEHFVWLTYLKNLKLQVLLYFSSKNGLGGLS